MVALLCLLVSTTVETISGKRQKNETSGGGGGEMNDNINNNKNNSKNKSTTADHLVPDHPCNLLPPPHT